ncbi:MAG: hypothetical protein KF746_17905 [Chitinophagaceae bacterium]|nr:hypothetical protein [Chitinophagaceae bacterium]
MYRLKKWLLIPYLLPVTFCSGQTFTTPEVYSFKQEVFSPVSYYTGQANISIPITQIQTPEITIPITLNYVGGGGLRAVNPYSSVGAGWRISAGGAITRTKNGVCDEFTRLANGITLDGFFSLAANTVTNSYVRNNVSSYTAHDALGQYFGPTTEYSPDVFSFSFLGYTGYFLMGYDGVFKIQSQDIVAVEKIDGISWPGAGNSIGFKLTANDGTIFTFGTTAGSMELSGGNAQPYEPHPVTPYQCDAWYLTEIKSTNGRIISFNYQPNASTFVRYKGSSETADESANCPVVLDYIGFNGGGVQFSSTTVTQNLIGSASYPRLINSIALKDPDNKVISRTTFTYSSYVSERYYFLDAMTVDDRTYSFGYYNRSELPNEITALGADYWGFYNGGAEVTSLGTGNVSSFWDMYLNPTVTYPARMPSLYYAKTGILQSITYPTGGAETYEYELNAYSYKGLQTLGGIYYKDVGAAQIAGGLRIAQITLGDMVRKYRYVTSFDPNAPNASSAGSGILYRLPGVPYFGRSALNALCIDGEPAVVYSKVIEFLADKSYTEYTMRSPLDKPDGDNTQNESYYSVYSSNSSVFSYNPQMAFVGSLGKSSSRSLERGQVSGMKIYDGTNTLKKSVTYTYATDPNRYTQNVAVVNIVSTADQAMSRLGLELGLSYFGSAFIFSIIHSYEVYTFPVYLEQETQTSYENGSTIQQITQYQYNSEKLRSVVTTTSSNGAVIKSEIKYPKDINTGIYATMVTKNMLNFPVEQVRFNDSNITGAQLTTYKLNGTSYVPDKRYSLEITAPFSGFTYFNGTTKDSRYGTVPEISYDSYGTYGNVRQTTGKDGIITSYLWDASGKYPMARVKGAAYSQISAQDGKAANYSGSTLFSALSGLAPSAFISTYSYKPLVGMTTATDQRGRTIYYNYDPFNRLVLIKDHDNNILKKYCYNYQGQTESCEYYGNLAISQTRRRNNCTGCQMGSLVTYSVPANTYYATTQPAANALAQDDITANAQNYANANGTCTASVMASLLSSNLITNKSFTVVFHNNCTSADYTYTLNANTSNVTLSPQIPTGNYNVTFTPVGGGTTSYGFWVNGFYEYGTSGNILGVDILPGSNDVRVYP